MAFINFFIVVSGRLMFGRKYIDIQTWRCRLKSACPILMSTYFLLKPLYSIICSRRLNLLQYSSFALYSLYIWLDTFGYIWVYLAVVLWVPIWLTVFVTVSCMKMRFYHALLGHKERKFKKESWDKFCGWRMTNRQKLYFAANQLGPSKKQVVPKWCGRLWYERI